MDTNNMTTKALNEFNEQSFHFQIPAVLFLAFMLPFGIIGNAFVIYIYGFRLKASNVQLFITFLAVSDIISCLVGIPMEVHRLYYFYNYSNKVACKIEGFFAFMCYLCSILILLVISIERYVKVCQSTKTQMSRKVAKILVCTAFLTSSLLAIPVLVLAAPRFYTLDNDIVVCSCLFHEQELAWYLTTFFVTALIILTVMFILYWHILKTAKKHLALRRKAQSSTMQVQESQIDKKKSRTTRTVIWISVVYMASCIPLFIVVMVTEYVIYSKAPNQLDYLLIFLSEFWILNCTLNPIVYGFFNCKFRAEFRNLLYFICRRKYFNTDSHGIQLD